MKSFVAFIIPKGPTKSRVIYKFLQYKNEKEFEIKQIRNMLKQALYMEKFSLVIITKYGT